jgi:hypothetical protein
MSAKWMGGREGGSEVVSAALRTDVSGAKSSDRCCSETRENIDIGKVGEGKIERK